ncbi:hypothetical protein B0T17DRAFT_615088 [Bombardia bombarda]|uniref:Uncharacterized protein n=1 Tax=Bombardia bombarda TaxID=252184 RepID=A0AA39X8J0_9PEZI|nr:hypothetical protein B0T17DRAFT_615088 [Bombardia bombarda]
MIPTPTEHELTDRWRHDSLTEPSSDPSRPSLAAFADAGHPFSVPMTGDVQNMLVGFDSKRMALATGPWLEPSANPFDLRSRKGVQLKVVLPDIQGGSASFRDGFSTHSGSSYDHLSAEVGVSVGYPFLSGSVSGKYDKTVMENENSVQASRNATCRVGRIVLDGPLPFSPEAVMLLCARDGPARFRQRYGDYYVCGYELGGDAGACLSASSASKSKTETLELTVTVKVLFVKVSVTHKTSSSSSSAESKLSFSGYNTLTKQTESVAVVSKRAYDEKQALINQAAVRYLATVANLPQEVRKRMRQLKLCDGQALPLNACADICQSGLVVQLLLAPYARLNQYVSLVSQPSLDMLIGDFPGDSEGDPRLAAAARLLLSA